MGLKAEISEARPETRGDKNHEEVRRAGY
jgi:hypothetical protein